MNPRPQRPRRLRVLQAITRLGLGGAEQIAATLARGLRDDIEFGFFTVHGRADDEIGRQMEGELSGWGVPWFRGTRLPTKLGGPVTGGWALRAAIRRFRPEVVHCHAEPAEACAAVWWAIAGRERVPLVRTVHNSRYWRFWPRVGAWCDRRLRSAHIACVSVAAEEEFLRYRAASGAGDPPTPAEVIYNGVSWPDTPPSQGPRDPGVVRVLYAGRFEPEKGPDVLCRALPAVRLPGGIRGELTLLGHGALEPAVRSLENRSPDGWTVRRRPASARMREELAGADLVVVPSRFEGIGLVAIEATLAGRPVVGTAAPGLREAFADDHPWLARPGDAEHLAAVLTEALHSSHRWEEVVHRGRLFARARFDLARMLESYRQLYHRACRRD